MAKRNKSKSKTADTPPVPTLTPPVPKLGIYVVAEGKSVTCKKGVLSAGDEIKVEYVGGEQFNLDKLVEKGYVKKV